MNNYPSYIDIGKRYERVDLLEKNRNNVIINDRNFKKSIPVQYQNDFRGFYQQPHTIYSNNKSIKSDPEILDRYGNNYEEGRRTLLDDVRTKYGVPCSGFILPNSDVKKYAVNRTPASAFTKVILPVETAKIYSPLYNR